MLPEFGLKEKRPPPPGLRLTGTCGAAAEEGGAEVELGGRAVVAASIAKPKSFNKYILSSPNNQFRLIYRRGPCRQCTTAKSSSSLFVTTARRQQVARAAHSFTHCSHKRASSTDLATTTNPERACLPPAAVCRALQSRDHETNQLARTHLRATNPKSFTRPTVETSKSAQTIYSN